MRTVDKLTIPQFEALLERVVERKLLHVMFRSVVYAE